MKLWRSLRWRLVGSYLALALVLLSFAGYIFSNALSLYAVIVQRQELLGYVDRVQALINEGRRQDESSDVTVQRLKQAFPGLQVDVTADFIGGVRLPPPAPSPKQVFIMSFPRDGNDSFDLPYRLDGGPPLRIHFTLRSGAGSILSSLYQQVLAVLALALALAGLIGWLLSRWLARPLGRLAAATEAVAGGDFLQTVAPTGVIELDPLTDQFNRMVLRLRESFRSLAAERDLAKRFAADAAHELKTPVTTLRAYHEVAEEHPERLPQVAPAMGRQIERMERVIAGLLEIARLSEGTGIALAPGDLGALLRELAPLYQALAEENELRFQADGLDQSLPVLLDRHLVELCVGNLIDNACKYTPAGGQVTLQVRKDGGDAVVTVADTGKGIAPEELPYIFERFHRGVDTQSLPGTGLGLAIAGEAVQRMGGTLTAESTVAAGSRFSIRLPLRCSV
ncbi:MAG TPA: HAMP domain-containing sensor histidine kinase [Symbiobacteriaceae bacterium]|jgi:signal transduction histidine kinase